MVKTKELDEAPIGEGVVGGRKWQACRVSRGRAGPSHALIQ